VAIAGIFMAVLGIALAGMLALASKRLYVYEDPRIDEVEGLLPKSNCGACGTAGCRNFAEKVVTGEVIPAQCTVNAPSQNEIIADLLGVDAGSIDRKVARLACAGGVHVAYLRARYSGLHSCRAATIVGGGGKECAWGCLGLGDCATVCDFGAISMDVHGLPVVDAGLCTACNDCVDVCPKKLFSLQPVGHKLWMACRNRADGDIAEAACEVACTACGKCTVDAPDLIKLDGQLAVIDYTRNELATRSAIDRCPTGAIVWFDDPNHASKGASAKKVLRQEALPHNVASGV
jgi:Na+-translocating ferredoxin:NAD+ oxidoreductase RNF subunit RnfB